MEKMSISFTKCEIEEIRALLVNQEENYEEWGEKNNAEFVRGIIEKIDNNQKKSDMETSMTAINKWVFFCMNYPSDFISKVWADSAILAEHLQGKFDYFYDRYKAMGVMTAFYAELDGGHKKKLMAWVLDNWNDEQKLNFKNE